MDDVRTVQKLNMQPQSIQESCRTMKHLRGIPFDCYDDAEPTVLIGVDQSYLNIPLRAYEGKPGEPSAIKTRLGWVLFGPANGSERASILHHHVQKCTCEERDEDLHQLVKSYFMTETEGVQSNTPESDEDKRSRQIMEETTRKVEGSDRYETGLLWRFDKVQFPDNYSMALRRLKNLEAKMEREPELGENIKMQIAEYITNGYARKLSQDESTIVTPRTWILPMFAVRNVNKPKRVRLVWDAAASINGISLNTMLLKGPDLLCSLMEVLFKFRQKPIAICGDIKHMFHQIRIVGEDQNSQRFLWRDGDVTRQPDQYVMSVMTFGASCSPSSSQFVKNKNAEEFRKDFPRAAEAITMNHYVDDYLDSVDTIEEAVELATQVKYVHSKAGFFIRNWLSNSSEVKNALDAGETTEIRSLSLSDEAEKVLGMWWNTRTDRFCFKLNFARIDPEIMNGNRTPTKRELLRTLMSLYDPLGLISFVTTNVKVLLQDVWRKGIEWDEVLPDSLSERWIHWSEILSSVVNISIPRCYLDGIDYSKEVDVELHLFSDASESAYATVAYARVVQTNQVRLSLIGSRTKVAPLHPMSIPRLELQGALLSARYGSSIKKGHTMSFSKVTYWTDSEVVLRWLRSDQRKYRQYAALRIGEIIETTDVENWRWVPSKLNVADDATKWTTNTKLRSDMRWFVGPEFLLKDPSEWPIDKTKKEGDPSDELKHQHLAHIRKKVHPYVIPDSTRVSHWRILVRTHALVIRFVLRFTDMWKKRRSPVKGVVPSPTSDEFLHAEYSIIRSIQWESYPEEMSLITENPETTVPKTSSLCKFSPYVDQHGVMRHRGRIDAAYGIPDEAKRPIILPREHDVTHKIVFYYHRKFHHANDETVLNEMRQRFTIPKLRVVYKKVKRRCQQCIINRAKPKPPEMGDLPDARLSSFTRPFTYTGVDVFGPMEIAKGRSIEKRYGVLFTCLTVRAVHIELAETLEADQLIMCIRDFVARRGQPRQLYSDNGTNMHGANNELQRALLDVPEMLRKHYDSIQWIFIPPSSPHMGGAWERLVQSIKKVLKSTLPTRRPSERILRSMLTEAESIVNARPLTHVAVDPDEPTALTPNHFLLGSSTGIKPIGIFSDKDAILRPSWRKSQWFAQIFWERWSREYLPTIIRREKWWEKVAPLKVGDLVIIHDDRERNSWERGVVLEARMGSGDQVRSVVVKTARGVYTRPSTKVAVLDVKTNSKPPSEGIYGGECHE